MDLLQRQIFVLLGELRGDLMDLNSIIYTSNPNYDFGLDYCNDHHTRYITINQTLLVVSDIGLKLFPTLTIDELKFISDSNIEKQSLKSLQ